MGVKAVIYARISISTEESVSVDRQLQSGRDHCRAHGWTVVGEYIDDGSSASKYKPEDRRGWQQVLAHEGDLDKVVVWKVDRLARRVLDFLHADQSLKARGAGLVAVADPIDMTTATGRAFATLLATFAEMEAEAIRARVTAAKRALIQAGRVSGGAAPYGYMNAPNPAGQGKVLARDPEQIKFVIGAVERVMDGASVYSVAKWLDAEGAPPKSRKNSGPWSVTVVRRLLENPVLAGMTPYNPGNTGKSRGKDVLRGSNGLPVIREDLAIMTPAEHRALLKKLADRSQPRAKQGRSSALLSGLVLCTRCERTMYRNVKVVSGERVPFFRCEGCHSSVRRLEDHVVAKFLRLHGHEPVVRVEELSAPAEDAVALGEVQAAIDEAVGRMDDEDVDEVALASRLKTLKEERRRLRENPSQSRSVKVTPRPIRDAWRAADGNLDELRSLFVGKVERVWLRPAGGRTGRNFDPSRITMDVRPLSEEEKHEFAEVFHFWRSGPEGPWSPLPA